MLYLKPGIYFQEIEIPMFINDELYRPGVGIAKLLSQPFGSLP
jgi:hypothetical protein